MPTPLHSNRPAKSNCFAVYIAPKVIAIVPTELAGRMIAEKYLNYIGNPADIKVEIRPYYLNDSPF